MRLTMSRIGSERDLGVGICLAFGWPDNLLLDSLKGLALLILARQGQARRLVVCR